MTTTKILIIGFILSVVWSFLFRRHWVQRRDVVKNKERGNFGIVLDVDPTRQGILVNFMNPNSHVQYTAWFNIGEFQSRKGIELK